MQGRPTTTRRPCTRACCSTGRSAVGPCPSSASPGGRTPVWSVWALSERYGACRRPVLLPSIQFVMSWPHACPRVQAQACKMVLGMQSRPCPNGDLHEKPLAVQQHTRLHRLLMGLRHALHTCTDMCVWWSVDFVGIPARLHPEGLCPFGRPCLAHACGHNSNAVKLPGS